MLTTKLMKAMELIGQAQTMLTDTGNDQAILLAADLDDRLHDISDLYQAFTGGKK